MKKISLTEFEEPPEEELEALMKEVAIEAKENFQKALLELEKKIAEEILNVRTRNS